MHVLNYHKQSHSGRMWLWVVVLILSSQSFLFAQKTSKELGEEVFNVFRSEDISGIDSLLPTFKEISAKIRDIGLERTDEEMKAFEQQYLTAVEHYKLACMHILEVGRTDMITWSETVLDSVTTKKDYIQMEDTEPPVILASNVITVHFSYKYWHYQFVLRGTSESNGIMKLGQDKIEFYEL